MFGPDVADRFCMTTLPKLLTCGFNARKSYLSLPRKDRYTRVICICRILDSPDKSIFRMLRRNGQIVDTAIREGIEGEELNDHDPATQEIRYRYRRP
jgi:hypothetical protein